MTSSGVSFQSHERYSFSSLSLSAMRLLRWLENLYSPRVTRSTTVKVAVCHLDLNMLSLGGLRTSQVITKERLRCLFQWMDLVTAYPARGSTFRRDWLRQAARPAKLFIAPSSFDGHISITCCRHRHCWPNASTTIIYSRSLYCLQPR